MINVVIDRVFLFILIGFKGRIVVFDGMFFV